MSERGAWRRVTVPGAVPYDVVIGPGAQAELGLVLAGTSKAAVVHAPPLAALAGAVVETLQSAGVAAEAVAVPDGETAKTAEVAAGLWEEFGRLGLTRSDAVVGIGGGAVTDLAGFVAATWTRGVRVVQVPTSLLGMVDAAIGGKTGINTAAGKNLVGAFHPPAAVLADTDVLPGLPEAEFRSGLAEIVKCGFIADGAILDLLDADPTGRQATEELVTRAVQVKADAVGEDRELVAAMGLPTSYAGDWAELQSVMRVDKKARGASLRFVVLDGLGNPTILTDPDQAWLDAAWHAVSGEAA
jgi:3-dehydroquinate synthase